MIYDGEKFSYKNESSSTGLGITFPGGHVERGESNDGYQRNQRRNYQPYSILKFCGIKNWYDDKAFSLASSCFTRQSTILVCCNPQMKEEVWWEDFNLSHLKLATSDMSDMLRVFL